MLGAQANLRVPNHEGCEDHGDVNQSPSMQVERQTCDALEPLDREARLLADFTQRCILRLLPLLDATVDHFPRPGAASPMGATHNENVKACG